MKANNIRAALLAAAAAAVAIFAPGVCAQQVDLNKPIVIKQIEPKVKRVKFTGYVQHMNNVQITVRSKDNELMIRTFTYSPEVRERIQEILDLGGFQYGDQVTIEYEAGKDIALKVKGKMSPSH